LWYVFWVIVSNILNVKEILKIYLIEQKIYPNHQDEWYIYHNDLSCYVSDCTVGQIIAFWLAETSSLLGFLPKFLFLEVQDGHHCKVNLTWEPTVDISRLHVYSYLKLKYWTISSHGLLQDVCVCVEQKCKMGATIASLNKRTNFKMKKYSF
jgi:hypothetical protein